MKKMLVVSLLLGFQLEASEEERRAFYQRNTTMIVGAVSLCIIGISLQQMSENQPDDSSAAAICTIIGSLTAIGGASILGEALGNRTIMNAKIRPRVQNPETQRLVGLWRQHYDSMGSSVIPIIPSGSNQVADQDLRRVTFAGNV